MTTTETYGGICPNCGYTKMMMRYGSHGWFLYDACQKCGFAYGTNWRDPPKTGNELWKSLVEYDGAIAELKGFKKSRKGIFDMIESLPEILNERTSIFKWDDVPKEELQRYVGDCP